ncbi:MAG: amino acid transporter [marine bacterium B5-7]|nr:MAG: amino acid transporter [marine bacterium B5-7]
MFRAAVEFFVRLVNYTLSSKMTTPLKRCLSLWEIVVYGVGLILGAGIYVLIGATAGIAGNMLWLSFLVASVVAGFTAMSYAELSSLFPKSAAEFVFARAAFGSDALAWMIGFCAVIIGFTTASAVAVGFAQYLKLFVSIDHLFLAFGLIVLMSLINFWGIKESARFNMVATAIEAGGLMLVIVVGGYQIIDNIIPAADLLALPQQTQNSSHSLLPVVSAGALIFFAYLGFEDIANIAEEAENPQKVLPKAFIYALVISTVIYILIAVVTVSVVPYQVLATAEQPLSLVMETLIGGIAPDIIAIIALFATANTVLITLIVGARMLYGMAQGGALPPLLARVHPGRQTPWPAIVVMALVTLLFLTFRKIEVLASISDVGIFVLFFAVNLSNIVLRYRQPDLVRSWRAPLNIGSFPLISALGALSCLLMLLTINHPVDIFGKQISSLIVGLLIFALAIPAYFLFGRKGPDANMKTS